MGFGFGVWLFFFFTTAFVVSQKAGSGSAAAGFRATAWGWLSWPIGHVALLQLCGIRARAAGRQVI